MEITTAELIMAMSDEEVVAFFDELLIRSVMQVTSEMRFEIE